MHRSDHELRTGVKRETAARVISVDRVVDLHQYWQPQHVAVSAKEDENESGQESHVHRLHQKLGCHQPFVDAEAAVVVADTAQFSHRIYVSRSLIITRKPS